MRVITYDEYDEMGREAAIAEIRRVVGTGPTYVTYDIEGSIRRRRPAPPCSSRAASRCATRR